MVVKDVLISGVADTDIRKEVLGWSELDTKTDKDVVAFVEEREVATKAWTGSSVGAAVSSGYRKGIKTVEETNDPAIQKKLAMKGKCSKCSTQISLYVRMRNSGKINKSPFLMCSKCFRESSHQKKPADASEPQVSGVSESSAIASFIGAIDTPISVAESASDSAVQACTVLDHHIFTADGWKRATSLSHPALRLRIATLEADYLDFGRAHPKISPKHIDVIIDSGAQSCLWSKKEFQKCGFSSEDLIPVHHAMKAANTAPITIDGAILLRLSGVSKQGDVVEAAVMAYISPDTDSFFLSKEAMVQLGIISQDFPQLGASSPMPIELNCHSVANQKPLESLQHGIDSPLADCGCPKRQMPPPKPEELPFPCTQENIGKMKSWLLNRYASSSFNKCPHQTLPEMEGPPIQIMSMMPLNQYS